MGTSLAFDLNQLRLGDRIRVHRKPVLQSSGCRLMNSRGPVVSPRPKIMRAGVLEGIVIELHRFGKYPRMLIRRTDIGRPQDVFISLDHNELLSIEHIADGRVHMVHINPIRKYTPPTLHQRATLHQRVERNMALPQVPSILSSYKGESKSKNSYRPLVSNK